jgi:hypothetical protein
MRITKNKLSLSLLFCSFVSQPVLSSIATYQLTVTNDWTQSNNPANYPVDAHFSWLGGGTHDASQSYWQPGGTANAGFERMAETGVTTDFVNEVAASGTPLEWQHWFCQPGTVNPSCGSLTEQFTIDSSKPLITLTSMLGPSPDWFIGVSGLSLQAGGNWLNSITVPLALYDAGTEEGNTPVMNGADTSPKMPISLVAYDPVSGTYVPTTEEYIVGSFTFELVSVSAVPLPASLWLFISGLLGLFTYRFRR